MREKLSMKKVDLSHIMLDLILRIKKAFKEVLEVKDFKLLKYIYSTERFKALNECIDKLKKEFYGLFRKSRLNEIEKFIYNDDFDLISMFTKYLDKINNRLSRYSETYNNSFKDNIDMINNKKMNIKRKFYF